MTHCGHPFHFMTKTELRQSNNARKYQYVQEKFRDKIRDKIVRFFAKIYRFVEKSSRKTKEEKVSKKHDFKPFQSG